MVMDERSKRMFLLWRQRLEFKQLIAETVAVIRRCVDANKCVVAYSGGKDSTVLAHIALQVDPEIDVFHWDHGSQLMPQEIETELLINARKIGVKNLVVASSKAVERSDMRENWKGWYAIFWGNLARIKAEHGWQTQFVGLRSEEGCKRRAKTRKPTKDEVYPLTAWGWRDIWAYIISNNLPYPKMYDVYAPLLGWDKARFVTFFDQEFEKFGSPYLDGFFFPQYRNKK